MPWTDGLPEGCRLVVFDLDGTLYRQGPVRRALLRDRLLTGGPPGRLARLRLLRRYRVLREAGVGGAAGVEAALCEAVARENGADARAVRRLAREWMEERPLRRLRRARLPGADALFAALRRRGVRIAVWSDYPVVPKLAALGLEADDTAYADDPDIRALKPDPTGLGVLLSRAKVRPMQALMIGDRTERDGAAAAALGVPFLLRARSGPPGVPRLADFTGLAASLS